MTPDPLPRIDPGHMLVAFDPGDPTAPPQLLVRAANRTSVRWQPQAVQRHDRAARLADVVAARWLRWSGRGTR